MKERVIAFCLGPHDVIGPQEYLAPVGLEDESSMIRRPMRGENAFKSGLEIAGPTRQNFIHRAFQRELKSLPIERLEEVVDDLHRKRVDREPVMGRHEDDGRSMVGGKLPHNPKAVDTGDLHIQKNDIRRSLAYCRHGLDSIPAFSFDIHGRFVA